MTTDEGAAAFRPARWPVLLGLALPFSLIVASALLVPASAGTFLGISLSSWCLFACAPVTSLCLAACWRWGAAASEREDAQAQP